MDYTGLPQEPVCYPQKEWGIGKARDPRPQRLAPSIRRMGSRWLGHGHLPTRLPRAAYQKPCISPHRPCHSPCRQTLTLRRPCLLRSSDFYSPAHPTSGHNFLASYLGRLQRLSRLHPRPCPRSLLIPLTPFLHH